MHYTFNCQECVGKRNILVTQYPLQETVVDFWTMVYDADSTVVVVLELINEAIILPWNSTGSRIYLITAAF
jgi:protein tyrosine phosphatase